MPYLTLGILIILGLLATIHWGLGPKVELYLAVGGTVLAVCIACYDYYRGRKNLDNKSRTGPTS